MDVFKVKKAYATSVAVGILRPALILGLSVFVAFTPYFKMPEWGPLILIGAVAWAAYEGFNAYRTFSFEVAVSDDAIRVRDVTKSWSEISRGQIKPALGMDPAIVLICADGTELKVPGALENLSYVATFVEKYVAEVEKKA